MDSETQKKSLFNEYKGEGESLGLKGKELKEYIQEQRAAQAQREEREIATQVQREERAAQTQNEERDAERRYQLEVKRIEFEANAQAQLSASNHSATTQSHSAKVKLPYLEDKDDLESYLAQFEKVAIINGWNKEEWGARMAPLLKGRARDAYIKLPVSQAANFDAIKEALLHKYQLSASAYRQKFRSARKEGDETSLSLWDRLTLWLERWIDLSKKKAEDIKEMLILEKFLEALPFDQARFIREKDPQDGREAVAAAELFEQARQVERHYRGPKPVSKPATPSQSSSFNKGKGYFSKPAEIGNKFGGQVQQQRNQQQKQREPQTFGLRCYTCGGPHLARYCKKGQNNSAAICTTVSTETSAAVVPETLCEMCKEIKFEPKCTVTVEGQITSAIRDTGTTMTIVKKTLIPQRCYTGQVKEVTLASSKVKRSLPVAKVFLETPYFTGGSEVLVMEEPIIPVLIGNMRKDGESEQTKIPVYPVYSAAVHKAQNHPGDSKGASLKLKTSSLGSITPEMLKREQSADSTLEKLFQIAEKSDNLKKTKNGTEFRYAVKNGILYRKVKTSKGQNSQVIVPKKLRNEVMRVAHDIPMSAHAGVRRTKERLLNDFYWPGLIGDVQRYCASCDACQRCIGRNSVRKAPLQKMPLIETPFHRVGVDIIGPISPESSSGKKYILTVIDYATRYAEATALRDVRSETVAEALWEIWSRVGIPNQVLTDRGSQFVSGTMQEVNRLLSIKGITTTPYHAQTNGLVERFNGTLQAMLRKLCLDQPTEWDRLLPAILFAYREAPQESLKFSPFELLYGRHVRGPLQVLKQVWTDEELEPEVRNTAEYVIDLRERIEGACKIAQENLGKAADRYAKSFNKKTKKRNLEPGTKVLILLPKKHNKLQLTWRGPYTVVKKMNPVDYKIMVEGKEKTYHINLLKQYLERNQDQNEVYVAVVMQEEDHDDYLTDHIPLMPLTQTENSSQVTYGPALDDKQRKELEAVVKENAEIFTDLPGETDLVTCDLKLTTQKPVNVHQYPVPHSQMDTIRNEVDQMLSMGVIEPACSPYNAPIVLVRKKDNSVRFCIDYRKLNIVTEFDAEPLPDIDAIFAKVSRAKFYTKIDLSKGFWQIKMNDGDKAKTSFSTPQGQFQWRRMPFGMKNASAVFTRMMRKLLSTTSLTDVHNFIDDILIASETWEEHVLAVRIVLERLREVGLTVKPSKCYMGHQEISFLGHHIGQGTIQPEADKLHKLRATLQPKTKKELRSFLGLAGYYRKFVSNFATVAAPLTDLTKKHLPDKLEWSDSCEKAMESLKTELTSEPIMCLPDQSKPYVLRTDASDMGLGAVLLQEHDEILRPVAYASKKLNSPEKNYATIEKECLAIVWGIKKFEPYLYGTSFIVETDHQPLQYLKKNKTGNGRLMRWAILLQDYDFVIRVIKGTDNVGADYMSRSTTPEDH